MINLLKSLCPLCLCGLFFTGCASPVKPLQPVSVAPITVIGSNVTKAKESNENTKKKIQAGDTKSALDSANSTQAILEVTEKQVELYRAEILVKNREIDKHNESMAGLAESRDRFKAAMWQRNWIILGMSAALAGLLFWIFKGPIMSAVGFIVRKFGGVPW